MQNRYMYIIMSILFLGFSQKGRAQQSFQQLIDTTISIESDARLDSLVMRHIRVNEQATGFNGYRVQLYSGSGTQARQDANNLRAEYMGMYPNTPAYLIYQAPNFKVRVGDFRTELDAIRLQRELAYQYPAAFVVRDLIKFPKLLIEQEQTEEIDNGSEAEEPQEYQEENENDK